MDIFSTVLTSFARFLVGGVFLWSGGVKLPDLEGFGLIASSYSLVPRWAQDVVQRISYAVPFVELLVAGLIIMWEYPLYALGAALGQFVLYSFLLAWEVINQTGMDNCGCYGTTFEVAPSWSHVVQNLVMAGLTVYLMAAIMYGGI